MTDPMADGAPRGRILVVDDQQDVCWILSRLLSDRGHALRTAGSGARALAALEGFECQVAVVDFRLPDTNGLDLIVELTSRLPCLRSILMTSYGAAALEERVRQARLFAFLDKPFGNDLAIRTVEEALGAWHAGADSPGRDTAARTRFPGRKLPGTSS